ncbi:MAG: hypothetical protein IPH38_11170 [Candidatus Microthrix sp.]|nr:hypothetical protein [Candidatus Microthrix sp.]MBK7020122.1 hypothetical protein [Candidatus Microthrix sp.]
MSDAVEAATGSDHQVFATSARRAIEARSSSDQAARDAGTDALHQALTNFVDRNWWRCDSRRLPWRCVALPTNWQTPTHSPRR